MSQNEARGRNCRGGMNESCRSFHFLSKKQNTIDRTEQRCPPPGRHCWLTAVIAPRSAGPLQSTHPTACPTCRVLGRMSLLDFHEISLNRKSRPRDFGSSIKRKEILSNTKYVSDLYNLYTIF